VTGRIARRLLLMACLLVATLTGGCWDIMDIKDQALVFGMAIDAAPGGGFLVSLQVPQPTPSAGRQETSPHGTARTVSVVAPTLVEAFPMAQTLVAQALQFGHLRTVILGEQLARDSAASEHVLEALLRSPLIDDSAFLLVAHGQASDIINCPAQPFVSLFINDLLDNVRQGLPIGSRAVWEMLRDIQTPGREPFAPGVRATVEGPQVSGTAIFDGFRIVGWLDEAETKGFLFLIGRGDGLAIAVPTPDGEAGIQILTVTSHQLPRVENGRPVVEVSTRLTGVITRKPPRLTLIDSSAFRDITRYTEQQVEREMRLALNALQKRLNADAAGMGRSFYYRMPAVWQKLNWKREFPDLKVRITTHAVLSRKGLLK
jgi:spore germination protein KC